MKRLLLFLLVALPLSAQINGPHRKIFSSGGSSVTLVQSALPTSNCSAGGAVTTCAGVAFGSNTTAGNTIAVLLCWLGTTGTGGSTNNITSVTGQGTFTVITGSLINFGITTNYSNVGCEWAVATGITGGATTAETCHFASVDNGAICIAYELTPSTSNQSSTGSGLTVPNIAAASVTSGANGAFLLDGTIQDDGSGCACGYTAGSTWTFDKTIGAGNFDAGVQHLAQTTAAASTSPLTTNRSPALWVDSQLVLHN